MPFVTPLDVLPRPPRRVVSLVPSLTELLAALGLDAEVVGLTRFCVHPEGWKARKAVVGGTKNLRLDRIEALRPDLVLANKEENERAPVEAIAEFAPVHVADVATVPDALAMIRTVGRLVHRAPEADRLADEIETGFGRLGGATDPVRAAYLIWRDPWMTAGGDTFISDVMARAGLPNVFAHERRYPETTLDAIREAGAEVVLLSSEPYPFKAAHQAEVEAATGLPALLVDGEAFSWYGSRMLLALPALAKTHRRALGAVRPEPAPSGWTPRTRPR